MVKYDIFQQVEPRDWSLVGTGVEGHDPEGALRAFLSKNSRLGNDSRDFMLAPARNISYLTAENVIEPRLTIRPSVAVAKPAGAGGEAQ